MKSYIGLYLFTLEIGKNPHCWVSVLLGFFADTKKEFGSIPISNLHHLRHLFSGSRNLSELSQLFFEKFLLTIYQNQYDVTGRA